MQFQYNINAKRVTPELIAHQNYDWLKDKNINNTVSKVNDIMENDENFLERLKKVFSGEKKWQKIKLSTTPQHKFIHVYSIYEY